MRQIDATSLRPGLRLPLGLYTRQGVKLLSAGTLLTDDMCRAITQARWHDLYLASSAVDLQDPVSIRLTDAAAIRSAAHDGALSVEEVFGSAPEQSLEGIHADACALGAILGGPQPIDARLRAARTKIADQYVADRMEEWKRLPLRIGPTATPAWLEPRAPESLPEWPDESRLTHFRDERVRRFRRTFARILSGLPVAFGEANVIAAELVTLCRAHPERFTQLALLAPESDDYLPQHCYGTACLAVAIASRLNWSTAHVRLAGAAGLFADVGMGLVSSDVRVSGRPLNEIELNRVRRHPTYSVVMLEAVEQLPEEIRLSAYQHHERENGTGYPRGLRGHAICDLAKVVAVADCFAASASLRRYRVSKRPYDAIEEIVMQASSGLFERRCVRALVESTGLFPVGSHVLLSNNTPAVVVGVQPEAIDRPIVRVLQRTGGGTVLGVTVHLADFGRNELWISRPIDPPGDFAAAV